MCDALKRYNVAINLNLREKYEEKESHRTYAMCGYSFEYWDNSMK